MCLFPKLIRNKKYVANKKNQGQPPIMKDGRVALVPVGCGKCVECRKKTARDWKIRLNEEVKHNENGKFVTLTFSNEEYTELAKEVQGEGYELDNRIAKLAVRRFLERWRKKYKKSVRHWLVTELGHKGTEHLHLHGIIWADDATEIEKIWKYGFVWKGKKVNNSIVNYVSERTINYIVKYVTKVDQKHKEYKQIILCSPGIGRNYENSYNFKKNKFNEYETNEKYITKNGRELPLPIYYRNKVYTEEEREQLWLNKLDENKIYIMGEEVKADDIETINGLLKYYRRQNAEMGFGSPGTWTDKHPNRSYFCY